MAQGDGQQVAWLDALVAQVRYWHNVALKSGGAAGEHPARLYASCARPFHTAFGNDLFPSDVDKAAALLHAIVCNHPFIDGNKRTATLAVPLWLVSRGALTDILPLQVHFIGDVALETASGGLKTVEQVTFWLHRILDL